MPHASSASVAGLVSCDIRRFLIRIPVGNTIEASQTTAELSHPSNIPKAAIGPDPIVSSSVVSTEVVGASSKAKVFVKRNTVIKSSSSEEEEESYPKVPSKRVLSKKSSKRKCQSQSGSKHKPKIKIKCDDFIDDEAECDSSFVDDGSCDESNSDAREMWKSEVQEAAAAMRNRRAFADDANMCPLCKQIRAIFIHILGLRK
jgi:hypothetical protein